ncbi:alpha-galactosidase [Mollicutes bacterium LVI A0039]|nr:alpha-galactosidase [Mollicutes bacterium LVI A0039]
MNIKYNKEEQTFHLYNEKISYVMKVLLHGEIGHLYYGERLYGDSFAHMYYQKHYPSVSVYREVSGYSMSGMRQEYSSFGGTDFSVGSYTIRQANGSKLSEFEFQSFKVLEDKPKIPNLPSSSGKSLTLEIKLVDQLTKVSMYLYYTIFADSSVIARSTRFVNKSLSPLYLEHALSAQLDFDENDFNLVQLDGAWARERNITKRQIEQGRTIIESTLGASGHIQNPLMVLTKGNADEYQGQVYAMTLVYSGSFIGTVDVASHKRTRLSMGIHPLNFEWKLDDEFWTPEAILNYSSCGISNLTHEFHSFVRNNIMKLKPSFKRTKFLTNNWEATYFNFNGPQIIEIAKEAKKCGCEMFVLDDGWFGKRNDDTSSLGDWQVNEQKLQMSMATLSREIKDIGLDFGIWIEPEMISKESDLYKIHPELAIQTPNRRMSVGRKQFVLDFSNMDIVKSIFNQLTKVLDDIDFDYIKWDMNRNITEAYSVSLTPDCQGEFYHRYIMGVYRLYEMLYERYPNVIIEGCAGGGGRFDLGILAYSSQIWTSDDTDPVERLKTQFGTSILYPLASMVNHVSAVKNHQTGRVTSLDYKAAVAFFGNFGYEINFLELSDKEKIQIAKQMKFYDEYQDVFLKGKFYRLESPFEADSNLVSMMSVYNETSVVGIYTNLYQTNAPVRRVKLKGLDAKAQYHCSDGNTYYGSELMNIGYLVINATCGTSVFDFEHTGESDFSSTIIVLKKYKI